MREGDFRTEKQGKAVDYMLAEVRESGALPKDIGIAIHALHRMDMDGLFDQFHNEVVSIFEGFEWEDTDEGWDFWAAMYEKVLSEDGEYAKNSC